MTWTDGEGATQQYTLTVTKAGSGSGTVTSSPAGINCGSDCSEPYNQGTKITLKVKADPGSSFKGWSGGCTGTSSSCKLMITSDQTVTATFGLPDLRGELSDISVKLNKSTYEISGKLTVYADEGKAAGVSARVYLSYDDTYYQDGDLLGLISIGTINAGSSKSKTFKYKGTHDPSGMYVIAVIDPDNIVQESNKKNNIATSYYRGEAPQLEVRPDESSRVSAVLQYGEGSLETTSGGSNLTLTLLPQSLMGSPEISLTGLGGITGLPQGMAMLAGAQLGPEGTWLLKPATLTIGLPAGAPTEGLIGFLSQDDGRKFQFYPTEVNGSTVTFEMIHFTSVGVAAITCSDISTLANPTWLQGQALAEYRIAIAGAKYKLNCGHFGDQDSLWDAYLDEMAGILEDWYFGKVGVLEQLEYVPENPEDYMLSVYQFVRWVKFTELIGIQDRGLTKEQPCGLQSGENCKTFDDLERGGKDAIVNTIRNGIIAANKACLDGDSTKDAIALKWLLIAENLQKLGLYLSISPDATELWELKTCGIYSLEVSPSQATINEGCTIQLQAIAKDKAGNILSGYTVDWLSSDKAIAVVDKNSGLVTGVKGGTTFISAFLQQNFLLNAYADITVKPIKPLSITYLWPDEPKKELGVFGEFGWEQGKVFVGGQEVAVKQWGYWGITCDLPPDVAGDVYVEVNGRKSNVVPLTEWKGQFRYTYKSCRCENILDCHYYPVEWKLICDFRFRQDIQSFGAMESPLSTQGAADSKCRWDLSGDPKCSTDCVGEWIYEGNPYCVDPNSCKPNIFLLHWQIYPNRKNVCFTLGFEKPLDWWPERLCASFNMGDVSSPWPQNSYCSPQSGVPGFPCMGRTGSAILLFWLNMDNDFAVEAIRREYRRDFITDCEEYSILEWDRIEAKYPPKK